MQFNIEKKISNFIESQFPQFYLEEGEKFVEFVKAYLDKAPIQEFPPPANIGGTDPINMVNAVPEMDPALIPPSPTPTPKKKK